MRRIWKLTVASFRMYFRQKEAWIWSFLLPLFLIVLFSFVKFDGMSSIAVGIVDESGQTLRDSSWVSELRKVSSLVLSRGTKAEELQALEKGDRDLVIIVPPLFMADSARMRLAILTNDERVQQAQVGTLIVQRALDEAAFERAALGNRPRGEVTPMKSRRLTYVDFLLPGVISMSIMQLGIFGVAFGFVSLKKRGILRRLSATPIHPADFIIGQVIMRVVVTMMQIGVMVGVGLLFLHLHFVGNIALMFCVGVLGAVVFLGMGFSVAGISKSEDQVAPLANLLTLPMMLLSGVFFSRTNLPGIVRHIVDLFPLSFLADALRSIALEGASLGHVVPQLIGLCIWGIITCGLAIKLFRWE